jgi:hypothetical protein
MTIFRKLFASFLVLAALQLSACSKNEAYNPDGNAAASEEDMNASAEEMNVEENVENVSDINNQAATNAGQALPEFRIPAPQASAQMELPRSLLPAGEPSLEQVGNALRARLNAAGYDDIGVYRVTNGFALATGMERIAPDGRPFQGQGRWATDASGLASFSGPLSLGGMLESLLHADPGSYRVMVFVVTNRPVTNSAAPMKSDLARTLAVKGASGVPHRFSEAKFALDYRVTALIYEFNRTSVGKPAEFSRPSSRSAAAQLRLANILKG